MLHGELRIHKVVEASFGENAYVLSAPAAALEREAADRGPTPVGWIIDPGFEPSADTILEYVRDKQIRVEKIVLTHGHLDHVAGLDEVKEAHPHAPVWMPRPEWGFLQDATLNLSAPYGFPVVLQTRAEEDLAPEMTLKLGTLEFVVKDVAGHSPGGRALYCAQAGVAIVGDALFAGSIGRTDFPGCDHAGLIRRIRENLLTLPDETVVYSGHGPATRVGNERKFNPFLAE